MVEQIVMRSGWQATNNGWSIESIKPTSGASFSEQADSCIEQLVGFIGSEKTPDYFITQQTFFITANSREEYESRSSLIREKLSSISCTSLPATSVVAQSPAPGREVVLELICTKAKKGKEISYRRAAGLNYTVVNHGDFKVVHATGMMGGVRDNIRESAEKAFRDATEILDNEGLSIHHIVRQWNYVENIAHVDDIEDSMQNYQIFNDVRAKYYDRGTFRYGYPAATGIGMTTGGVIIGFIAISESDQVKVSPIRNPRQIDAHSYSEGVLMGKDTGIMAGKCTPKFERGKMVTFDGKTYLYVSGTASIVGEKTMHPDDVKKQTVTTIDNIFELFSQENQGTLGLSFDLAEIEFSHLRVYVKHKEDIPAVKAICEEKLNFRSFLYLESDICREELLVEIEGIFSIRSGN